MPAQTENMEEIPMDGKSKAGDTAAALKSAASAGAGHGAELNIQRILQQIATGTELVRLLEEIALLWERHSALYPRCAVTLRSADGDRVWVAAAPSLPPAFRGMMWRSNGAAALFTSEIESSVTDLAADPGAIPDGGLLLGLGLRACWRLPVLGSRGQVLGALIAFSPQPASPGAADRALMERLGHLIRIAIEKSQVESEVAHLSSFDALTELPNRAFLLDRLGRALAHAARQGRRTALLLLNLDGMSRINESLGYAFGDEFIKAVARRLREQARKAQTLARFGGDEFAVLIEDAPEEPALAEQAQALLACMTRPLKVAGQEMFVTASLGADLASGKGVDADVLFRHADAALRRAKARGGNSFRLYAPDMDASAGRLQLLGELNRALERGEFQVHYQPQLDLHDGGIAGAEALIRWQHPRRGLVSPAEFVPLLEETGLILPVGAWLLRRVCADMASLVHQGTAPPKIAVNLSARQFHQPELAEQIADALRDAGLDGSCLGIELTESLMVQEPELTVQCLQRLKGMGTAIAVDDFGIGYSSLGYLKQFPVDVLKIDKCFVDGMADCASDAAIVDAIIHMAHSLGLRTVAEGVETPAQRSFLASRGCDVLQGYLYSEPLALDAFAAFLSGHRSPAPAAACGDVRTTA